MIQKYKITLTLTADDYMAMIPHLGSVSPKIEKVVDKTGLEELRSVRRCAGAARVEVRTASASRRSSTRSSRRCRTAQERAPPNFAGPRSRSEGMSESSLSTGLSNPCRRAASNKRDPDSGEYHLAAREAA